MNKTNLFVPMVWMAGMLITSCGGNQPQPEATAEDTPSGISGTFTIDPAASFVAWDGTMLGIYTHTGTLAVTEGSFTVRDGQVINVSATVDMNSMLATDENYDPAQGNTPEKLIGHLKSADFFDVANHPTAGWVTRGVSAEGALVGELTVRGVTNVENVVEFGYDETSGTASARLTIDRKAYNVAWDHPLKDRVLSNDIGVKIMLKAAQ